MRDWKAAGPAPKDVDDALWKRFRGAQDTFFGARDAANAALDAEFAENAVVKEQLLAEAEALLPVTDVDAAKKAFRDLSDRWDAAGKVPRDRMKELEGRMRAVEQAIRSIEDDQWKRSDPEKSARADDMVRQARGRHPRPRGRPRAGSLGRQREGGPRARGEPHLPPLLPRHGQARQRRLRRLTPPSPARRVLSGGYPPPRGGAAARQLRGNSALQQERGGFSRSRGYGGGYSVRYWVTR